MKMKTWMRDWAIRFFGLRGSWHWARNQMLQGWTVSSKSMTVSRVTWYCRIDYLHARGLVFSNQPFPDISNLEHWELVVEEGSGFEWLQHCVTWKRWAIVPVKEPVSSVNSSVGSKDKRTLPKIIAVDFDGTLAETAFPGIGEPNLGLIRRLIKERENGAKLILWTCRMHERLDEAVAWCHQQGLTFDAVNDNIPESIAFYGNLNPRKVFAHVLIDDTAWAMEKWLEKLLEDQ